MTFRPLALALAAATLAAGVLPVAASAQQYGGYNNGGGYNGRYNVAGGRNHEARGVVANVNGTDLTLRNGRHVYMHQGTVIRPNGATITAGQRITAHGYDAYNGNLRAEEVTIRGGYGGNNGYRGNGSNGYRGNY